MQAKSSSKEASSFLLKIITSTPFRLAFVRKSIHQPNLNIQNPIPSFSLPLRERDSEPIFDLQAILHDLYDRASYDLVIDYTQDPVPALSNTDKDWLHTFLQENGLR